MISSKLKIQLSYFLVTIFVLVVGFILLNDYLGDPSIYYIYSKNISEGYFLNFNKGEFSSGATSPLWATLLSIPFLFSSNVIYAKMFSLFIALAAHLFLFHRLNEHSKLLSLNISLFFVVSYYTLINGLMSYETSLLLIFIPILVDSISKKNSIKFYLSASVLPLIRPDAMVLSLLGFVIYWSMNKYSIKNLAYFALSLLPFILYISYSYIFTGTYSSSSYCRSFALAENASTLLGFKFSLSTIISFISFPAVILLLLNFRKPIRNIDTFTLLCFIIYLIVFSFIKPIANHPERYLAPVFILLSMNIVLKYSDIDQLKGKVNLIFYTIATLVLIMIVVKVNKYHNSYNSNQVLEYSLAQVINEIENDSKILTYEVQSRYFIDDRHKIISLDGIIDGKVAPYLESSKMIDFINEYKPDYWVANDAVEYRNYLKNSELYEIYNLEIELGETIKLENINFKLVHKNDEDLGKLANWKKIYKLTY